MGFVKKRMNTRKGQVLLWVLVISFIAAILAFTLILWSQEAHMLSMRSTADLARTRLIHAMSLEVSSDVSASPQAALSGDTTVTLPEYATKAQVEWGDQSPQHPLAQNATSGNALFSQEHTQSVGYGAAGTLPDWHRQAKVNLPGGQAEALVVRSGLPFAASAPWGSLEIAGEVDSWNNAPFDDKTSGATLAAAPVRLQSYNDLTLDGGFSYGLATSEKGSVKLPDQCTGLGVEQYAVLPDGLDSLVAQIGAGQQNLHSGTLDKTDFFSGQVLDPKGFWEVLTGKASLLMIFSIQQQCNMPFPAVPSIYNEDILEILAIHAPYPADFQASAFTPKQLLQKLLDLINPINIAKQAISDAEQLVKKAADTLANLGKAVWDVIRGKIHQAKEDLEKAKNDLVAATKAFVDAVNILSDFFNPFRDILKGLGDLGAPIPRTLAEEKDYTTTGWAYFTVLRRIEGSLGAFVEGIFKGNFDNLIYDLMNPTRVFHFTDRAPFGGFSSDGGFTLAFTLDVPRGRTLRIGPQDGHSTADFVILGDVWVQRGATLVIDGNLFVQTPPQDIWLYDQSGDSGPEFRPTGTIYLEEGASVVVSGNLYAEGSGVRPSVIVASDYDQTPMLNSGIICGGDVRLPHGVGPGVTFLSMLTKISSDVPLAGTIAQNVLGPLLNDVAPHLAKAFGPFHERVCYFSKFATTFVVIPELAEFGLQGPWPIPLPYNNCMVEIFNAFTKISRIGLNFTLGDNLMTHSDWWILGEGIVPILPKVSADTLVSAVESQLVAFGNDFTPQNILNEVEKEVKQLVPTLIDDVVEEVVQAIIKNIVGEATGDDACSGSAPKASGQEEEDAVQETLQEVAKSIGGELEKAFEAAISSAADTMETDIADELGPGAMREVSGALVFSGGALNIGGEGGIAPTAVGLFVANGDVKIQAMHTVGAVSSRTGDVSVQGDLHFYPFFTQGFLYDPQSPDSYAYGSDVPKWLRGFEEIFGDAIYLKTPTGGKPMDMVTQTAVVTAQGRVKP